MKDSCNSASSTFLHTSHTTAMASLHRLTLSPSRSTLSPTSAASSTCTMNYMFVTPRGKSCIISIPSTASYDAFLRALLEKAAAMDHPGYARPIHELDACDDETPFERVSKGLGVVRKWNLPCERSVRRRVDHVPTIVGEDDEETSSSSSCSSSSSVSPSSYDIAMKESQSKEDHLMKPASATFSSHQRLSNVHFSKLAFVVFNGKILDRESYYGLTSSSSNVQENFVYHISLRLRVCGGIDRQNRVGSKFGGGGVSSTQQSERERKDRLRQLALETVDLAKDPYLMRNHLGTYECKLCLTLHTNEG